MEKVCFSLTSEPEYVSETRKVLLTCMAVEEPFSLYISQKKEKIRTISESRVFFSANKLQLLLE